MISSVQSTISALQAYKTQLEVSSNNVANVVTEGFKKSKAVLREGADGDVQVNVQPADDPGHRYQALDGDQTVDKETSNVDLADEFPQITLTQHAYKANMKIIHTQDEILGTVLNIIG